jgi:hypothetical protein
MPKEQLKRPAPRTGRWREESTPQPQSNRDNHKDSWRDNFRRP